MVQYCSQLIYLLNFISKKGKAMNYYDMKDLYVKNALAFERMNYKISLLSEKFIARIYDRVRELFDKNYTYLQMQQQVSLIMSDEFSKLDDYIKGEILTIYNKENDNIAEILKKVIRDESETKLTTIQNDAVLYNPAEDNKFYTTEFTKYQSDMYNTVLPAVNTALIANYSVAEAKTFISTTENLTTAQASTLTRTIMKNTQNDASTELFKSNNINYVRYTAILDSRTTSACRSLNNLIFDLDKAPRLPLHYNCRSTYIPLLNRQVKDAEKDVEDFQAWYQRNKNDPDLKNYGFIMN